MVKDKFDQYIFCDNDADNLKALQQRVSFIHKEKNVSYLNGDCNLIIDDIINCIPKHSMANKVLSFCFVDPFSLNIEFETIKKLSNYFIDFLVLLALGMDANRNFQSEYINKNSNRIDKFLGLNNWRQRWDKAFAKGDSVIKFLAEEYNKQMVSIGYIDKGISGFIPINFDEKNVLLYYLAFFSKNTKGYDFWDKVKKRNTEPSLFE